MGEAGVAGGADLGGGRLASENGGVGAGFELGETAGDDCDVVEAALADVRAGCGDWDDGSVRREVGRDRGEHVGERFGEGADCREFIEVDGAVKVCGAWAESPGFLVGQAAVFAGGFDYQTTF